ncbi:pentatricopeptide repeat-containing protein, mitochondrial-like [Cocos nucifera]|uniref:Pentatricopeptide repeat-containing protein, mitochondrial-like n=1 Tax=Cocos nucifera TaxID=13894 RepID=A0A8K0I7R3_COCNU|nr:pentatricopeptide repeat-containing protein, mitochondrial-like [Cocos nucifera]
MSSLHSPSTRPISPPPFFFSSRCKSSHLRYFSESYLQGKRPQLTSNPRRGNPTPLPTVVFSCGVHPTSTQARKFLAFIRNSRLPTRSVELLDFVEKNGIFRQSSVKDGVIPTKQADKMVDFVMENGDVSNEENAANCDTSEGVGEYPYLVKEDCRIAETEKVHFAEENDVLDTDREREELGFVEGNGTLPTEEGYDVAHVIEENGGMLEKEQDVLVDFTESEVYSPTDNVKSLDSCHRSGRLHVGELVQKISCLPIEERVMVLDLFEYDDKSLTISDYNDILIALVKAGEFESAVSLFSELRSRGLSPDSLSFSIMVQCLCKKNDPDEAKQVLDEMVQSGFRPNIITFTALVNSLCKRGRLKKALEVFEIMNQVGCEPTIRTYNCLISGLCYVGRLEEAFQLLQKIKKSPKMPDIYTFTLVVDGFCKVGRSDEAIELLIEAQEMGLKPTIVTYNALLNGYCKEGRPLEGLRLLEEMQHGDCLPDYISYSTILQGLLRWGEVSEAWKTYKKMKEAGFQVDVRVMNTLLRGLCRQSTINSELLKDAKELFGKVTEMDFGPSPYTYCLMVQALAIGGEMDEALDLLHEMVRAGYSPRMMTYNVILRTLCEEGRVNDALGILVLMIKREKIPSRFSFRVLLNELNRQGRLLDAFGVYAAAIKRDVISNWKPQKVWQNEEELNHIQEGESNIYQSSEEYLTCANTNVAK